MSSVNKPASMKHALEQIMGSFVDVAERHPERMAAASRIRDIAGALGWLKEDPFGDFADSADRLFMAQARQYITRHQQEMTMTETDTLLRKFAVAKMGIGVVALFSEVGPLVHFRDRNTALSPEKAPKLMGNFYCFIDKALQSGSRLGKRFGGLSRGVESDPSKDKIFQGANRKSTRMNPIHMS